MSEWQRLAESLVELDIQIEELDGWATRPEDLSRLKELEALRGRVRFALASRHVPRGLQRRVRSRDDDLRIGPVANDPRD
ncbi:MAG TPA: hypothetical protein VFI04_03405 [Gaiellaceae bacterium]|jgi:hypothetical protein|nr:hypothetical protein [Gaiellaceae bacterium]